MKKILKDMESSMGMEIGVVITRNGIPMAWNSTGNTDIETFATLSATIYGASEVIFSGVNRAPPEVVIVSSPEGVFVASGLGKKGIVSGICKSGDSQLLFDGMKTASGMIMEVL